MHKSSSLFQVLDVGDHFGNSVDYHASFAQSTHTKAASPHWTSSAIVMGLYIEQVPGSQGRRLAI